jgi:RNA polymerase sigma-70 factor (ECF subfamily)
VLRARETMSILQGDLACSIREPFLVYYQHGTRHTERAHASMTTEKVVNTPDTTGYSNEGENTHTLSTDLSTTGIEEINTHSLAWLYEHYRKPIHSYIYRLLGSQEDADDIMQEVFIRACVAWEHLYERENLSAWLYRIATNLCIDLLRRRKRISWWTLNRRQQNDRREEESEDASALLPDSGGIPEVAEREHIRLALAKMPRDYAIILVLSAAQGVPYQEIASIVGVSPNAAATRISRAKKMFIEHYQRISQECAAKGERQG